MVTVPKEWTLGFTLIICPLGVQAHNSLHHNKRKDEPGCVNFLQTFTMMQNLMKPLMHLDISFITHCGASGNPEPCLHLEHSVLLPALSSPFPEFPVLCH